MTRTPKLAGVEAFANLDGLHSVAKLVDFRDAKSDPLQFFKQETMHGGDHAKGNRGMDAAGNVGPKLRVKGKRDSMYYDDNFGETMYISPNEGMILRPFKSPHPDLTRDAYTDPLGREIRWDLNKYYGPFGISKNRIWGGDDIGHIDDPELPGILVGRGQLRQWKVNFSNKCIPGMRTSFWEMGYIMDLIKREWVNHLMYDDKINNGVEIDHEIDPGRRDIIMQKFVSGDAGDTSTRCAWIEEGKESNGMVNLVKRFGPNFDLYKGWHTLGVWQCDDIVLFLVDGYITNWDFRSPDCLNYLLATMETNSNVHDDADPSYEIQSVYPFRPADPGLFGVNAYDNIHHVEKEKTIVANLDIFNMPKIPKSVIDWCLERDTSEYAEEVRQERNGTITITDLGKAGGTDEPRVVDTVDTDDQPDYIVPPEYVLPLEEDEEEEEEEDPEPEPVTQILCPTCFGKGTIDYDLSITET